MIGWSTLRSRTKVGPVYVKRNLSDRKLVAAALEALKKGPCRIVNAADTDWYDWLDELHKNGIEVLQLLPGWSHDKWLEKKHP